jgi:hypothetical protein
MNVFGVSGGGFVVNGLERCPSRSAQGVGYQGWAAIILVTAASLKGVVNR